MFSTGRNLGGVPSGLQPLLLGAGTQRGSGTAFGKVELPSSGLCDLPGSKGSEIPARPH